MLLFHLQDSVISATSFIFLHEVFSQSHGFANVAFSLPADFCESVLATPSADSCKGIVTDSPKFLKVFIALPPADLQDNFFLLMGDFAKDADA